MKAISFIIEVVLIFLISYAVFAAVAAFTMMDLSLFNIMNWDEFPRLMLVLITGALYFIFNMSRHR